MLPDVPYRQQRALANLVWEANEALAPAPERSLAPWIERWSDVSTRPTVAAELLRCVASAMVWNSDWLAQKLAECAPYWDDPAQRIEALRGIYADRVEGKHVSAWADFSALGESPDSLSLRYGHDPVCLGQILDGLYQCEARIGSGGFGVVFRGLDGQNRAVAVKLPYGSPESLPQCAALIRKEARILNELRGPGIPEFQALMELGGDYTALVMQYIPGGSLFVLARQETLGVQRSARIVGQLADSLEHAHARGLVHCDVKPENVLIDEAGMPYITDFGLALDEEARFSAGHSLGMTPAYAAPETIVGLKQQLDARADVYALGSILVELLTGKRVVRRTSREDAFVEGIVAGSRVLEFPDDVPVALREVCQRALRLDPNERHNTAAEFAVAVRSAINETNRGRTGPAVTELPDEETQAKYLPRLRQLRAWRMGMKLGGALERHAQFRRLIQEAPTAIYAEHLDQVRRDLKTTLAPEISACLLCDDLRTLAAELGSSLARFPHDVGLWQAFYFTRKATNDQISAIRDKVEDASRYLDATYESLLAALQGEPHEASTFALAVRVNLVGVSSEARNTLESEAQNAQLPSELWQPFLARVQGGRTEPDSQRVVVQLDKRIEQFLLRGQLP